MERREGGMERDRGILSVDSFSKYLQTARTRRAEAGNWELNPVVPQWVTGGQEFNPITTASLNMH